MSRPLLESNSQKAWTVLVVDDNPSEAEPLIQRLAEVGWQVLFAASVQEARNVVETQKPDAIICDLEMPLQGGYKLMEAIGNNPKTHDMPFLLANRDWDFTNWSRIAGGRSADCHVMKPYDSDTLQGVVALLSRMFISIGS